MNILSSIDELRSLQRPVHWAMGFFDGVHRGHRRVIESASTPGALRGVFTFAEHPLALLWPEIQPRLLTPDAEQKADLMRELGVDILLRLPFTRRIAALGPAEFLNILQAACPIAGISVGSNWRFGRDGAGDTDFVQEYAAQHGIRTCVQPLLEQAGETVCSSRIRSCLAAGRLAECEEMLGRPFSICGTVEHGQHLARQLGYPTANITLPPHAALPPFGVYAVSCRYGDTTLCGMANIGLRPTIDETEKPIRLEAHFTNWNGDLYGKRLEISLTRFIRPELRFDGIESLRKQIALDLTRL
ncbi:MAG: riboflavin biosynthesis protein RibF [Akkermansia sp.]|nr:riboflavin biosynthesis protein RibF [Akkermansia sp.]